MKCFRILVLAVFFVVAGSLAVLAQTSLPESFSGIPLFAGATVLSATNTPQGEVATVEVPLAPAGDIVNFYKHDLSTKGWLLHMEMIQPETAALMMTKGKSQLMLAVNEPAGGKRLYTLTLITQ